MTAQRWREEQSEDLVCTERDMVIDAVLDLDGRLLMDYGVDVFDFDRCGCHKCGGRVEEMLLVGLEVVG